MATEQLLPQCQRRPDSQALLLLLMASMMCPSATSSTALTTTTLVQPLELTLLASAAKKGAVCLDGSPPGYQLQRGSGSGSHNWIVYLEGGGWCSTIEDCSKRKKTRLGSSNLMEAVQLAGIFSNDRRQNSGITDQISTTGT